MTISPSKQELQRAFIDFARSIDWRRPFALTLTLKQRVHNQNIDSCIASVNFRHFMNRLNRKMHGNAASRHNKHLTAIPVLEHNELVRYHYHAIVDCPERTDEAEFKKAIRHSWQKTQWGYEQIVIEPIANDGWLRYMAKFRQKPHYDLAIDWMNVHANSQPT